MSSPINIVVNNFYARLSLHDKDLLDASCFGSFTHMKEEAKWDLLDRIQENTEGWENDKGRNLGINYDYECVESFMRTDDFRNTSAVYGLDCQILANCLRLLLLILMFLKKSGTSIMHLIKILLVVFLLEVLKFVPLIVFFLNLTLRKYLSLPR